MIFRRQTCRQCTCIQFTPRILISTFLSGALHHQTSEILAAIAFAALKISQTKHWISDIPICCPVSRCGDAQRASKRTAIPRVHLLEQSLAWATVRCSCGLLNKTIGLFFKSSAYLWFTQNKDFFPSVRFFQHQSSSSFRGKIVPQANDTSSLINKQFDMCDTLRLLWIWIRNPSQSLADTALNLFGCIFCQRIITREKKKSFTYVCRLREFVCDHSSRFVDLPCCCQ